MDERKGEKWAWMCVTHIRNIKGTLLDNIEGRHMGVNLDLCTIIIADG